MSADPTTSFGPDGGPALICNACGHRYPAGSGYLLECCRDGLLCGDYPPQFEIDRRFRSLWRFHTWLPVATPGDDTVGSVCEPARELGEAIGLHDLWISYNGFRPGTGVTCPTGSFKDLEVAPTLQRLIECGAPGVVVATAGNTGRAFGHLAGLIGYPVIVVVAEAHLDRIWRPGAEQAPTTRIVALHDADYGDATAAANEVANAAGWQVEGGVRNVARRDGIGTLLLDAVVEMGHLPDHYVQAVGGGPGPIGVGDMCTRLVAAGGFGERMPRFHLVQNTEHHPVDSAWRDRRSHLVPEDFPPGAVETYADVLVNRAPAYGMRGGLYDLLTRSQGQTYAVSRSAAEAAQRLFQERGIEVLEPAAVALAGLVEAVDQGEIGPDDRVLLAVTGGGIEALARDQGIHAPTDVVHSTITDGPAAITRLMSDLEA